jgi:succinate dehydrogenase / fumarate reductase cytochrome b subunit
MQLSNPKRPLSPHLQIYQLPLTALLSITHRMTGLALSIGLLFFGYSLITITLGNDAYFNMQSQLNRPVGKILLWLFIYALFFHLCHGIRHLIWDLGKDFNKETLNKHALIELVTSVNLTLIAWIFL